MPDQTGTSPLKCVIREVAMSGSNNHKKKFYLPFIAWIHPRTEAFICLFRLPLMEIFTHLICSAALSNGKLGIRTLALVKQ